VLNQTQNRGVDLVVEVGGGGTLGQSLQAVRIGGTIAQIGVLSGAEEALSIPLVLHRQVRLQGIYVGSRADFETMNRAIAGAKLRPVIDRVFAFREAREALKMMENGTQFGKIVIQVVA
jgi:NADPH:quinone reductase-like Zn-dependent oxidoreductase